MTLNHIIRLAVLSLPIALAVPARSAEDTIRQFDLPTTERLGRAIYDQDQLVWKATDVLFAQIAKDKLTADKLHGWIVVDAGGQDIVRFIHDGAAGPEIYCEVRPSPRGLSPCNTPQQTALTPDDLAQYAARQTALADIARPCSDRYNTVVLKDPERDDWLVWALAATTQPNVVVYGGHYRFTISKDGKTIVQRDALSRGCMNAPLTGGPADSKPAALFFSQIVSATPIETAVWLNLQHGLPLYLMTSDGTWRIDGGHITRLPAKSP